MGNEVVFSDLTQWSRTKRCIISSMSLVDVQEIVSNCGLWNEIWSEVYNASLQTQAGALGQPSRRGMEWNLRNEAGRIVDSLRRKEEKKGIEATSYPSEGLFVDPSYHRIFLCKEA